MSKTKAFISVLLLARQNLVAKQLDSIVFLIFKLEPDIMKHNNTPFFSVNEMWYLQIQESLI